MQTCINTHYIHLYLAFSPTLKQVMQLGNKFPQFSGHNVSHFSPWSLYAGLAVGDRMNSMARLDVCSATRALPPIVAARLRLSCR